MSYPG